VEAAAVERVELGLTPVRLIAPDGQLSSFDAEVLPMESCLLACKLLPHHGAKICVSLLRAI